MTAGSREPTPRPIPLFPIRRRTTGRSAPPPTPVRLDAIEGPSLDVDITRLTAQLTRHVRGERVLLPNVRGTDRDTLVVADGFSCREQIRQRTDQQALHLADVLKLALDNGRQETTNA